MHTVQDKEPFKSKQAVDLMQWILLLNSVLTIIVLRDVWWYEMSIITLKKEYADGEVCEIEHDTRYPSAVTFKQTGHNNMPDLNVDVTMQTIMNLIRGKWG